MSCRRLVFERVRVCDEAHFRIDVLGNHAGEHLECKLPDCKHSIFVSVQYKKAQCFSLRLLPFRPQLLQLTTQRLSTLHHIRIKDYSRQDDQRLGQPPSFWGATGTSHFLPFRVMYS